MAFLQNLRSSLFGHKATPLHNLDSSAHVLINLKRKTCASLKTVSSYDSSQSDNDNHQSIKDLYGHFSFIEDLAEYRFLQRIAVDYGSP